MTNPVLSSILVYITTIITSVSCYTVIYSKQFGSLSTSCSSDSTFVWKNASSQIVSDCDTSCTFSSTSTIASLLVVSDATYTLHFTTTETEYSQIGVDITFVSSSESIQLSLSGSATSPLTTPTPGLPVLTPTNNQSITCASSTLTHSSAHISSNINLGTTQGILELSRVSNTDFVGIHSFRVWVNCIENCLACVSISICTACLPGFELHTAIHSNGTHLTTCEVTQSCNTAISGCAQCYSIQNQNVCVKCDADYKLTTSTTCELNPVIPNVTCDTPAGEQYFDGYGNCMNYSSLAYSYDVSQQMWVSVSLIQQTPGYYKCMDKSLIMMIDSYSHWLYTCGCVVANCVECSAVSACEKCASGYYLDLIGSVCIPNSVANCASYSGENTVSTVCSTCLSGYFFKSSSVCVQVHQNDMMIRYDRQESIEQGIRVIFLANQEILVYRGQNYTAAVELVFESGISAEFTLFMYLDAQKMEEELLRVLYVEIYPNINVKQDRLNVTFVDAEFLRINQITGTYPTNIELIDFIYLSDEQRSVNEGVRVVGQVVSIVLASLMVWLIVSRKVYVVISLIDFAGFLYYTEFVDVRFPSNVVALNEMWENFRLQFIIPSVFEGVIDAEYVQESDAVFMRNGVQRYFLASSGQSLTVILCVVAVYLLLKCASYVLPFPYLKKAVYETWEFNAFFDLIWFVYLPIFIGVLVQLPCYDDAEKYFLLNYTLHSLGVFIVFTFPIYVCWKLYHVAYTINNTIELSNGGSGYEVISLFRVKYASLICALTGSNQLEGNEEKIRLEQQWQQQQQQQQRIVNRLDRYGVKLNEQVESCVSNESSPQNRQIGSLQVHRYSFSDSVSASGQVSGFRYMYVGVLYVRKVCFALVIVYGNWSAYLQLLLMCGLSIGMIAFVVIVKPFVEKVENVKSAASELGLLVIALVTCWLVEDRKDASEEERMRIGWVIVAIVGVILVWQFVSMVWEVCRDVVLFVRKREQRVQVATVDHVIGEKASFNNNNNNNNVEVQMKSRGSVMGVVKETAVDGVGIATENSVISQQKVGGGMWRSSIFSGGNHRSSFAVEAAAAAAVGSSRTMTNTGISQFGQVQTSEIGVVQMEQLATLGYDEASELNVGGLSKKNSIVSSLSQTQLRRKNSNFLNIVNPPEKKPNAVLLKRLSIQSSYDENEKEHSNSPSPNNRSKCYKIIFEQEFAQDTFGCAANDIFYWTNGQSSNSTDCSNSCNYDITLTTASLLLVSTNFYTFHFTLPTNTNFNDNIIGIDIVFLSSEPTIQLTLIGSAEYTTTVTTSNPPETILPSDSPSSQLLICPYGQSHFSMATAIISQVDQIVQQQLQAFEGTLIVSKTTPLSQVLGIRSIRLWTNCSPNCLTCATSTSYICDACLFDFPMHLRYSATTTTTKTLEATACEMTQNYCSESAGCEQCYRFVVGEPLICVKCLSGYTLNIQSQACEANDAFAPPGTLCSANEYISDRNGGGCVAYSSIAYYLDSSASAQWVSLQQTIDSKKYKCRIDELILIYNMYSNALFRCGCVFANCKACSTSDSCDACADGFYFDELMSICIPNSIENCATFLAGNDACSTCLSGYYFDSLRTVCIPNSIVNCANYNPNINRNVCSVCKNGYHLNQAQICVANKLVRMEFIPRIIRSNSILGVEETNNGRIRIELDLANPVDSFPIQLYFGIVLKNVLSVHLASNKSKFTWQIIEFADGFIQIEVEFLTTIKSDSVFLSFNGDAMFNEINCIGSNATIYQVAVQDYLYTSQEQMLANDIAGTSSDLVSLVLLCAIGVLFVMKSFYVIVNTIDLTGFLFYTLFVDVRYPSNVLSFYACFENFQFPFIPNLFEVFFLTGESSMYSQGEPSKAFQRNNTQRYFLSNSGQSLTILAVFLVVYACLKGVSRLKKRGGILVVIIVDYVKRVLHRRWEYTMLLDVVWSLYLYVIVGVFLQFECYEFSDSAYLINYSLHSVIACLGISLPIYITWVLAVKKDLQSDEEFTRRFDALVHGVRVSDYDRSGDVLQEEKVIPSKESDGSSDEKGDAQQFDYEKECSNPVVNVTQQNNQFMSISAGRDDVAAVDNDLLTEESKVNGRMDETAGVSSMASSGFKNLMKKKLKSSCTSFRESRSLFFMFPNADSVRSDESKNVEQVENSKQQQKERLKHQHSKASTAVDQIGDVDLRLQKKQQQQYQSGLKRLRNMYMGILYLRKLLFGLVIVYATEHPYLQLVLIGLLSAVVCVYVLLLQPLQGKYENVKNAVGELVIVLIVVVTWFLVEDDRDQSEEDRLLLGWIIIAFSAFILAWHTVQMVWEAVSQLKALIRVGLLNRIDKKEEGMKMQMQIGQREVKRDSGFKEKAVKGNQKDRQKVFPLENGLKECNKNKNNELTRDNLGKFEDIQRANQLEEKEKQQQYSIQSTKPIPSVDEQQSILDSILSGKKQRRTIFARLNISLSHYSKQGSLQSSKIDSNNHAGFVV